MRSIRQLGRRCRKLYDTKPQTRIVYSTTSAPSASEQQRADRQWIGSFVSSKVENPTMLFASLRLSQFSDEELKEAFDEADVDGDGTLTRKELYGAMRCATVGKSCSSELEARARAVSTQLLKPEEESIRYEEFRDRVVALAKKRDPRIWPIAFTMALGGLSVGCVMPVMPQLVHDLHISSLEYGFIVSAFGATKLIANVPASQFVDRYGRRLTIVSGLGVIAASFTMVGLANGPLSLALARAVNGGGVALLVAGSTLAATDISTPLNRASTTAPLGAAFNVGTVVGPAVGGGLANALGPSSTFFVVAGLIGLDALYASIFIQETSKRFKSAGGDDVTPERRRFPQTTPETTTSSQSSSVPWDLRIYYVSNASYWFAIAGVNMTVLPLCLSDSTGTHAMDPSMIGSLFAAQAVVSVAAAMPVASLADRVGPEHVIAPGFVVAATANALWPFAHSYEHVVAVMVTAALGSSLLGSAPTAAVANAVPSQQRPAALAFLRTAGDVGMLTGSATLGLVSSVWGYDAAFSVASVTLFSSAAAFTLSRRLLLQGPPPKKPPRI